MSYPYVKAANDYGPRKGPVKAFLVHMAEGGGTVGYLSRSPLRGVSVHYVIEYTGRIVRMLDEDHASGSVNPNEIRTDNDPDDFYGVTAAKAVMGQWWSDPNSAVISLEIEGFAASGPNSAQHGSLKVLVNDVRSRYPDMGLLGHRDFTSTKACPGKLIHWTDLGGHGPAQGVDVPGFPFRVPGGARSGMATIPAGVELFRLVDAAQSKSSATSGPATSAIHDVPGGSAGFNVTTSTGTYWVRSDDVTFTADVTAADCTALVTAEHDKVKAAAVAAAQAIP
jgi:hypothetical protein